MIYTYKGADYPKNITINHKEIADILGKDFDLMTRRDYETIMALYDDAADDFQSLVLQQIGHQWGKSSGQLAGDADVNANIISNALIYSAEPGFKGVSYELLLEVLRQSDDFIDFNLPYTDEPEYPYAMPLLWTMGRYNPKPLKDFLLEGGIGHRGKQIVANMTGRLANLLADEDNIEEYRQVIRDVVDAYISDFPKGRITDRQVMAYIVRAAADAGLNDIEPQVRYIYANGMVDEDICGDLDNTLFGLRYGADMDVPVTSAFKLFFAEPISF